MTNKKKAKILNGIGIAIMVVVVVMMFPLTVPKVFGLKLYNVMSGSMEPLYKEGGVVYVKPASASEVELGDIVSYITSSGTNIVTTHRVVDITDDGKFITKGDANNVEDAEPVIASRIVGKAVFYLPILGAVSNFIFSIKGACVCIMVFGVALLLWIYAGILEPSEKKPKEVKAKENSKAASFATAMGIVLIVIALLGGAAFAYTYIKAESDYDDLRDELELTLIETPESIENGTSTSGDFVGGNSSAGLFAHNNQEGIISSLEMLGDLYPNLVGWVLIPDTIIDYPIMHGSDDTFYLRHTYDGSWSRPGSIFLSADNNGDFSDKYNVIYGHNQNNGNMFASLINYDTDPEYYENHPTVYIATKEDGLREYQIFSYFYVYPTDAMYTIKYYNNAEYELLVNNMAKASRVDLGVEVSEDDEVIVLSTCNETAKLRFVVCAKRVMEEN